MADNTDADADRPVATYQIGELTMANIFRPNGITDVSDMQAVFDATEVALKAMAKPARPYSAYVDGKFCP
ncbi:MAG: hypothetical protein ABW169_05715 [Sphingobium sp.]